MPSRRTFLISSSAASCALQAQEQPKTHPPIPEQAGSGADIFEAAFRGDMKRAEAEYRLCLKLEPGFARAREALAKMGVSVAPAPPKR